MKPKNRVALVYQRLREKNLIPRLSPSPELRRKLALKPTSSASQSPSDKSSEQSDTPKISPTSSATSRPNKP